MARTNGRSNAPARWGRHPMRRFFRIYKDERGATAVEYGLILALIFLAMVGAVSMFATVTTEMWTNVAEEVRDA
jgi:pilus assembly protein Flp/PilA